MKILSRLDIKDGKIFVKLVLTSAELNQLIEGKVVNGELPEVSIRIVGYGEDNGTVTAKLRRENKVKE